MTNKRQKIADLQKKSFAQEIENDKKIVEQYFSNAQSKFQENNTKSLDDSQLSDTTKSLDASQLSDKTKNAVQNKLSSDVLKRALILLGSSDLQVIKSGEDSKSAAENNLPVASYLSHGSRTMIEIPPESGNELINWLTSGDKAQDGRSTTYTQDGAINEGKIVFARRAATHDVQIKDGKLTELKGFSIGLYDGIKSFMTGTTNHFGVNLNLNPYGDAKDKPDGEHGHLYIHYKAPTATQPGSLLIGLEASEPASPNHSKFGGSDPMSPVGSSLWEPLQKKLSNIIGILLPQKYNGLFVKLDRKKLDDITALDSLAVDAFDSEIGSKIPGKTLEDFKKAKTHKTPESKPLDDDLKTFNIVDSTKESMDSESIEEEFVIINSFTNSFTQMLETKDKSTSTVRSTVS